MITVENALNYRKDERTRDFSRRVIPLESRKWREIWEMWERGRCDWWSDANGVGKGGEGCYPGCGS